MSLTAFGQIVKVNPYRYEFHIGDYVLKYAWYYAEEGNGLYEGEFDWVEAQELAKFVKKNKEKLEKKFGVDISTIKVSDGNTLSMTKTVSIYIYEKGYWDRLKNEIRLEEENRNREIEKRLNSLNEIF